MSVSVVTPGMTTVKEMFDQECPFEKDLVLPERVYLWVLPEGKGMIPNDCLVRYPDGWPCPAFLVATLSEEMPTGTWMSGAITKGYVSRAMSLGDALAWAGREQDNVVGVYIEETDRRVYVR